MENSVFKTMMEADRPQVYELEYEKPQPEDDYGRLEVQEEKEAPLGDAYDLYGMLTAVHSRKTDMTRDYTLARYNSTIINEKFPKFIREQRKIVRILESFMVVPMATLLKRYTPQYAKKAHAAMRKSFHDVQGLLLGELDEMVIISRAGKGEPLKAGLLHGRSREEVDEYNEAVENSGTKGKLTEKG